MKTLEAVVEIPIRFSETDAMGVVWHGNYLKFFGVLRVFTLKIFRLTKPSNGKFYKILYFSNFCIYWRNGKSDPASKSNSATYFWG